MSSDTSSPASSSFEVPEFIKEAARNESDESKFDRLAEYPEFAINRALYAANNMETVERALLFQAAGNLRRAQRSAEQAAAKLPPLDENTKKTRRPRVIFDLEEWKHEVETTYPTKPLSFSAIPENGNSDSSSTNNYDKSARSAYVYEIMKQLLLAVRAPEAMILDFEHLVGPGNGILADRRADVQEVLIAHPDWSATKIAAEAGYHQTGMRKEIEGGLLTDYRDLRKKRSKRDKR